MAAAKTTAPKSFIPEGYKLPEGIDFQPTDKALLTYLRDKINCKKSVLEDRVIHNCNLYGTEEPWEIWDRFRPKYDELFSGKENNDNDFLEPDLYFFTKVKKKKGSGSRIERTTGNGTWHGENLGKGIKVGGKVVGFLKRFTYRSSRDKEDIQWIMHQYSIKGAELVLCRIRKKASVDFNKRDLSKVGSASVRGSIPRQEASASVHGVEELSTSNASEVGSGRGFSFLVDLNLPHLETSLLLPECDDGSTPHK